MVSKKKKPKQEQKKKIEKKDPLLEKLGGELSPDKRERLEKAVDTIRDLVEEVLPEGSSFEDYEKAVLEITNEIARRELERRLQTIADSHSDELRIDHNNDWHGWRDGTAFNYRKHLPGTVTYHSLVGGLRVQRYTYRENHRNGAIYVPLELDAGLMERMTPALARCVALGFAQMPIRQAESFLRAAGRNPPSRSTFDRSAKDLGAYAMAANAEIEPLVRAQETVPLDAHAILLGLDRTAVAMRNVDASRESLERDLRRPRPREQMNSRAIDGVSWRMDYVGTVVFVDAKGERIESREYRLPSEADPDVIVDRMIADVMHARAQRSDLSIAVVQDGAPELWNVIRKKLKEAGIKRWQELLDWYHVVERLSKCLELCQSSERARTSQKTIWHRALLENDAGGDSVVRSLRRHCRRLVGSEKDQLTEHLDYFEKRRSLMGYTRFRDQGLPIASGVTEGACKSLVGTRAKRSGQHWTRRGLGTALHLRAIEQSGRFDKYWEHFSRRYRATSMTPLA